MTADRDLCKQLEEVSGWRNVDNWYCYVVDLGSYDTDHWRVFNKANRPSGHKDQVPAYDLDYLLRKLPPYIATHDEHADDYLLTIRPNFAGTMWETIYVGLERLLYFQQADTPEDAVCKLAIELFQAGILKREEK